MYGSKRKVVPLMTCNDIFELIQRDLDGDLSEQEKRTLREHTEQCVSCAQLYERMQAVSFMVGEALPDIEPPVNIVDSIMPQLEDEIQSTSKRNRTIHKRWWIPSAAIVAILFLALLIKDPLFQSFSMSQSDSEAMPAEMADIASDDFADNESVMEEAEGMNDDVTSGSEGEGVVTEESIEDEEYSGGTNTLNRAKSDDEHEQKDVRQSNNEPLIKRTVKNEAGVAVAIMHPAEGERLYAPDGKYAVYLGLGEEDIRIDYLDEPNNISNNPVRAWRVTWIEWLSDTEMFYVLDHDGRYNEQYWLFNVETREESQLDKIPEQSFYKAE